MLRKVFFWRRSSRTLSLLRYRWTDVCFRWRTSNKGPLVFALAIGAVVSMFWFVMHSMVSSDRERQELTCLALNVYYEARGEPAAGRYAVAEVTMNRVASRRYAGTVCGVVYQKEWDVLRKRYVSAFSWTEFDSMPHPRGEHWQQAWDVAEAVYYGRHKPRLDGAVHYHATYIKPSWARGKRPVARIGKHVFYK
jgi:spore germination cell wall hydrolase CwlJ-like protein